VSQYLNARDNNVWPRWFLLGAQNSRHEFLFSCLTGIAKAVRRWKQNILGTSHVRHKTHKRQEGGGEVTRGTGHRHCGAQQAHAVNQMSNAPQHIRKMHPHQRKTPKHHGETGGDDVPHSNAISCGKLGHTAKLCGNRRQIHGGNDLATEKGFVKSPRKSPHWRIQTNSMYLMWRRTQEECPWSPNPIVFELLGRWETEKVEMTRVVMRM